MIEVITLRLARLKARGGDRDLDGQDDGSFAAVFDILVTQYMARCLRAALLGRIGAAVVFALARQAAARYGPLEPMFGTFVLLHDARAGAAPP